ncbi:MAG: aquaporin [Gemmatimonadetes bacterium]|nr:aquaporin [Gemmatimonadota bacterium]
MSDLARRSLAEAIATFMLVFVGVGAIAGDLLGSGIGLPGVALAFGFVVASMVYAIGHLTGAHLNPAVTVAFWSAGKFPLSDVPAYISAQCVGATAAAALLHVLVGLDPAIGTTVPSNGLALAWTIEVIITFSLMFVIASVATDDRSVPGFAGVAIGMAVSMGALAGGPFSGGSMNPARSLGPALVTGTWTDHWVYWTAPFIGAVLGAAAYEIVRVAGTRPAAEPDIPRPTTEV